MVLRAILIKIQSNFQGHSKVFESAFDISDFHTSLAQSLNASNCHFFIFKDCSIFQDARLVFG